jgi:hypothetical protein
MIRTANVCPPHRLVRRVFPWSSIVTPAHDTHGERVSGHDSVRRLRAPQLRVTSGLAGCAHRFVLPNSALFLVLMGLADSTYLGATSVKPTPVAQRTARVRCATLVSPQRGRLCGTGCCEMRGRVRLCKGGGAAFRSAAASTDSHREACRDQSVNRFTKNPTSRTGRRSCELMECRGPIAISMG